MKKSTKTQKGQKGQKAQTHRGPVKTLKTRNHAGVSSEALTAYQQWFRDTLRISSPKAGTAITTPKGQRVGQISSLETPSTIYTTPKQTPLTARGSKGNYINFQNKTINDEASANILKNGIMVLGDSPMKTIAIDLKPPRDSKLGIEPRISECSTRYQQMLVNSPPSPRRSPDVVYSNRVSRMSNRSAGSRISRSPRGNLDTSVKRTTYKEDPTGMQTIQEWQKVPQTSIDLVAKQKIQRHFNRHNSPSVQIDHKVQLQHSNQGYRTRAFFNKKNQSTNFVQMSPRLISFSHAMDGGQKRVLKANYQQYEKNVLKGRKTQAMREEAKYDSEKWQYTAEHLYDKFNGKLDDPNVANRGITGFTFSPEREARKMKMNDFKSGNISFDTNKIIQEYALKEQKRRDDVHVNPSQKHRRSKFSDMSSIQIVIGQDVRPPRENTSITGRAYSPRQHSRLEKQKHLESNIL